MPRTARPQWAPAAGESRNAAIVEPGDRWLLAALPLGILVLDLSGRIVHGNPAARRILGLALEQLRGRSWLDPRWSALREDGKPFPVDEHPAVRSLRTGEPQCAVVMGVIHAASGERRWLSVSTAMRHGEGRPAALYACFEDITARRESQLALAASEARLRFARSAAGIGVWEWDVAAGRLHWSPEMEALHGLAPGSFGGTLDAWLALVHADDRAEVEARLGRDFGGSGPFEIELRCAGGERWVASRGRIERDGSGRPRHVIAVSFDVTARRRAEGRLAAVRRKLELAVDVTGIGIYEYDAESERASVDARCLGMLGYAPGEIEMTRDVWYGMVHPEDLPAVWQAFVDDPSRVLRGVEVEYRLRHKSGRWVWVLDRAQGFDPDAGGPARVVIGTHLDITQRRQAQAALAEREMRYRAVVDTAADGFWVSDREGRLIEVNGVYCRGSGYSREQLLRMRIWDLDAGDDGRGAVRHIARVMQRGSDVCETLHRASDGTPWQSEVNTSYWPVQGGHSFTFVRDLTQRSRADALLRTRGRLSELALRVDLDGLVRAALDAAELLTGSRIAFLHLLDAGQAPCLVRSWCSRPGGGSGPNEGRAGGEAGAWTEAVRARRAVMRSGAGEAGSGTPEDAQVRELAVPVLTDGRVVAVLAVGDKSVDYDADDLEAARQLASIVMDIVARKQAEEALRASEERWALAIEGAGQGVWDWNPQTGKAFYSRAWKTMLGYAEEDIGDDAAEWERRVHPDDLPACRAEIERHFRGETPMLRSEHRLLCKDGSYKWILGRGRVERRAPDGAPLRVLGTHTDIDARRQVEERLRRSEEKLSNILRAAPIGIGVVSGRVLTEVNETFCEMVGYGREELLGRSTCFLYPHAEDDAFVGIERQRQAAAQGQCVETRVRRRDGRLIDLLLSSAPLDGRDVANGVSFAALDITQRKQRETALQRLSRIERAVAHSSSALLHAANEPDYLREVCRIIAEDCGHTRVWIGFPEGGRARAFQVAAQAGLQPDRLARLARAAQGRGPAVTALDSGSPAICRDLDGDARVRWRAEARRCGDRALAAFPLKDERGPAFGVLVIGSPNAQAFGPDEVELLALLAADLAFGVRTLRLRAAHVESEARTAQLRGELQQLVEWQVASHTAAGIAHGINQPLNAVTAYGQAALQLMAQLAQRPQQLATAIEGMVAHARDAGAIVRQLLAFFERGETAACSIDPGLLVREALLLIGGDGFRAVPIAVESARGLRQVCANRLQIEKVLLNLLRNALEALREAPGTQVPALAVRLAPLADRVRISVVDHGPGIDASMARRVFDAFVTTKSDGIGMGLTISRALVEAHGGRLWHEPTPGGGATFHFTLPVAP